MIRIELTRAELIAAGADCDGLAVFDSLALAKWGGDRLRYDWTEDRQIWAITCSDLRPHVGWLISVGLLPRISLRGADLYGADLSEANLYGADLRGADLSEADLYGADLYGADLYGADLYGADLSGADLRGADLYGADLRGADLSGADLRGADLRGADLRGANLRGANLRGAYRYPGDPTIPGWAVADGVLRRAT